MLEWRSKNILERLVMSLNERYGDEVGNWLQDVAEYEMAKYDCADNLRVAERGVWQEEEAFIEQGNRGCCGCFESEWTYKGRKFLIGFNYGH